MNSREFAEFLVDAQVAFPTLGEFITSSPDPDATHDAWAGALADCAVTDCQSALEAMLRGDIEPPRYKWDGLPAIIRNYAKRREETRNPVQQEWQRPQEPIGIVQQVQPVVQAILKRVRENGETIQQAHRAINPFSDVVTDPEKQPRFKCQWCLDSYTGLIMVWRYCIVVRFRDHYGDKELGDWKQETFAWLRKNRSKLEFFDVVACCCDSKAATTKRKSERRGGAIAVFDPDKMPVYRGESYRQIDELRQWIQEHERQLEFPTAKEWVY